MVTQDCITAAFTAAFDQFQANFQRQLPNLIQALLAQKFGTPLSIGNIMVLPPDPVQFPAATPSSSLLPFSLVISLMQCDSKPLVVEVEYTGYQYKNDSEDALLDAYHDMEINLFHDKPSETDDLPLCSPTSVQCDTVEKFNL